MRILPLLVFIAIAAFFATLILRSWQRPPPGTHRPRAKWRFGVDPGPPPARATAGTVHIVARRQLDGLRDAYSSAAIDPSRPLARCGACLALYHADSVLALRRENHGRCAVCGSTDIGPVRLAED